jgi:hypothetical protein
MWVVGKPVSTKILTTRKFASKRSGFRAATTVSSAKAKALNVFQDHHWALPPRADAKSWPLPRAAWDFPQVRQPYDLNRRCKCLLGAQLTDQFQFLCWLCGCKPAGKRDYPGSAIEIRCSLGNQLTDLDLDEPLENL